MIRIFSARVFFGLWTWPIPDSGFLLLERFISWSLPGAVYCGLDPVLVGADFHSQFGDLLDYDQRSSVLLLQPVIAACAPILTFALSSERTQQDSLRESKAYW